MLKVGDIYRKQLRVHAWRFENGLLPSGQAAMLTKTADLHGYATRSAQSGLAVMARDHPMVGYRIPSGLPLQSPRGAPWQLLRGGLGRGSWLFMGRLSVLMVNVGSVATRGVVAMQVVDNDNRGG